MGLAPNRVDWRWAKASEAAQYADSQAAYHLRGADPMVVAAYRFKRALDGGLPIEREDIADAYELFHNRPEQRLYVEGMLLGGLDDTAAGLGVCATADVVAAFHDIFFDVRSRRDHEGWIVSLLFQGMLYGNPTPRDRTGLMHRISWLGGADLFRAYYTGKFDPALRDKLLQRQSDMVAKQSLLTAMCIGHGSGEHHVGLMIGHIERAQAEVAKAAEHATGDKGLADTIMGFLQSIPTQVADPLDKANVNLPAREPRAHEYLHDGQPHAR